MSVKPLNICLLQSDLSWENKSLNLASFAAMISSRKETVDIFVLPEMFSTGFSMNPKLLAESMKGSSLEWMQEKAKETDALIVGSLIIKEDSNYFNRFIAMSPKGVIACYDKRHLFRMGEEETHYKAGTDRIVFEWRAWKILPQICYDLRFPVWMRNQDDYDLILLMANWPEPRREVWKSLLLARAIENQSYVAAVNRIGKDDKMINHAGDSMIIGPKGNIIADSGNLSGAITAKLSMDELLRFREHFPVKLDSDSFSLDS